MNLWFHSIPFYSFISFFRLLRINCDDLIKHPYLSTSTTCAPPLLVDEWRWSDERCCGSSERARVVQIKWPNVITGELIPFLSDPSHLTQSTSSSSSVSIIRYTGQVIGQVLPAKLLCNLRNRIGAEQSRAAIMKSTETKNNIRIEMSRPSRRPFYPEFSPPLLNFNLITAAAFEFHLFYSAIGVGGC